MAIIFKGSINVGMTKTKTKKLNSTYKHKCKMIKSSFQIIT